MADTTVGTSSAAPGRGQLVAGVAARLLNELDGSTYQMGGKTREKLDCSFFVYLALSFVFPEYRYLASAAIASDPMFSKVEKPEIGDVIYFPPSKDGWWQNRKGVSNPSREFPGHVGIVLSGQEWGACRPAARAA